VPTISREQFEQVVDELAAANDLNTSKLAKRLGVSRAWLYDNFPEVRDLSRQSCSEDDVIVEIERMRAERPYDRFTVEEVSERLGIVRQTFSRNFKHLYDYLNPDKEIFSPSSPEQSLLAQVKDLENRIKKLTDERESELSRKEDEIFSTLMRKDAEEFESIRASSSIKRLQDQAEDQAQIARQKTKEVANLRLEIAKLKANETQGGCEILNHIKPDYFPISVTKDVSLKNIIKLFNESEKRNLSLAEEIIVDQRPDYVIFFQPYLACDRSSIPALPMSGSAIIVESNVFRNEIRNEFVKSIRGAPIIALYAQTTLAKTKMFARGAKSPFSAEFIEKLHVNIMPPILDDGFSAVMSFDPEGFL